MIHRNTQNKLGKGRLHIWPTQQVQLHPELIVQSAPADSFISSFALLLLLLHSNICSDCTALHNRTRTTIQSTSNNNNNDGNGNCIDEKRKSISDFVCAVAYCDRWSSLIYSLFLI